DLTIVRDGKEMVLNVGTVLDESGSRMMGFQSSGYTDTGFGGTLKYAFYETKYNVDLVFTSLKMLFTGKASINDLSGPVGMVSMIGSTVDESREGGIRTVFLTLCFWIVLLSANLGIMNLLPIPALDGGRILFLIIEGIRGKPHNRKVEGTINFIFFVLLMMLMVYIMARDIIKLF
ncbi:MAG: site-2 protease family protein, partial [Lachnospiraceae bacterium]|nr:site-2 protease family protein [Lachnospiraceae bacterium]